MEYVYDGLMHLGADICLQTLERIVEADGHPESLPQEMSDDLKPAPKIFKETCEIDWNQPAKCIYDFVRGLSLYPGAWTTLVGPDGKETMLKIFRTTKTDQKSEGVGRIIADRKQLAGKKRMDAVSFLNGMKDIFVQTSVPEGRAEKYFVR